MRAVSGTSACCSISRRDTVLGSSLVSMTSPIIYAHRGASFELPENTLEAFGLALDLGADAIETDAHMTRDGRIVLSHDATGAKTAGVPLPIRDLTLSELRQWNVGARFIP